MFANSIFMVLLTHSIPRPCINGEYRFLSGVLDQSYWPDGIYLAPGDKALASDLEAVKNFGQNYVRLHQKVNPDRWYVRLHRTASYCTILSIT